MPNKRKPLSFAELEGRGRRAILRTAEEVQAEQDMMANKDDGLLEIQQDGMSETQHPGLVETGLSALDHQDAGKPANQQDGMSETQHPGSRTLYPKATYRLSPETL